MGPAAALIGAFLLAAGCGSPPVSRGADVGVGPSTRLGSRAARLVRFESDEDLDAYLDWQMESRRSAVRLPIPEDIPAPAPAPGPAHTGAMIRLGAHLALLRGCALHALRIEGGVLEHAGSVQVGEEGDDCLGLRAVGERAVAVTRGPAGGSLRPFAWGEAGWRRDAPIELRVAGELRLLPGPALALLGAEPIYRARREGDGVAVQPVAPPAWRREGETSWHPVIEPRDLVRDPDDPGATWRYTLVRCGPESALRACHGAGALMREGHITVARDAAYVVNLRGGDMLVYRLPAEGPPQVAMVSDAQPLSAAPGLVEGPRGVRLVSLATTDAGFAGSVLASSLLPWAAFARSAPSGVQPEHSPLRVPDVERAAEIVAAIGEGAVAYRVLYPTGPPSPLLVHGGAGVHALPLRGSAVEPLRLATGTTVLASERDRAQLAHVPDDGSAATVFELDRPVDRLPTMRVGRIPGAPPALAIRRLAVRLRGRVELLEEQGGALVRSGALDARSGSGPVRCAPDGACATQLLAIGSRLFVAFQSEVVEARWEDAGVREVRRASVNGAWNR